MGRLKWTHTPMPTRSCGQVVPGGYICDRFPGHNGSHVATSPETTVLTVWEEDER